MSSGRESPSDPPDLQGPDRSAQEDPCYTDSTNQHIRGSTLLLLGRCISLVLNFLVQVLTVRYLSKLDYGALSYALSVMAVAAIATAFGMDKAISRFGPVYQEHRDYPRMWGAIVLTTGSVLGLGLALVLLVLGLQGFLADSLQLDRLSLSVLLIVIALTPVSAFDSLLLSMFAVFVGPRSIFFRRHILGPGLKLIAVTTVILVNGDVFLLAISHLIAGIVGVVWCAALLLQVLRKKGLLAHFKLHGLRLPVREIFSFSLPLLSSDLAFLLRSSMVVIFLEYFDNTTSVAEFQAVLPVARLNDAVGATFAFLFMPIAARLFTQNRPELLSEMYWRTAMWMTVLSFPLFAVSCALARPLTVLLFGQRYLESSLLLAILSFGFFFDTALGFNLQVLQLLGKVRRIVMIDLLATGIALVLNLVLIPRFGALGGAIATSGTMVAHGILSQLALLYYIGIHPLQWRHAMVCAAATLSTLALLQFQSSYSPPLYAGLAIAAALSLLVLFFTRRILAVEQTFPELLRIPLVRRLFTPA